MQPTNVQVERSLQALRSSGEPHAGRHSVGRHRPGDIPLAVVEQVLGAPIGRTERLARARRLLASGQIPTDDALADRMVGRLVCDRLR